MKMADLAKEYRLSAAAVYRRITELKEVEASDTLCETELFKLRRRISILQGMYHDTCLTALIMERYYIKESI